MRYKKVQKTAYQGNSQRSLVLRHLCAKDMLDILNGDMIVINIDESSFIEADYRRQKWRQRQETNSISQKDISPRINVFAAIDTEGRSYLSITQCINNHEIFCLYLSKLVSKLQKERPNFRENTIFQLDGASMHTSEKTRNYLVNLGIKVFFTAPYGVSTSLLLTLPSIMSALSRCSSAG